MSKTGAKGKVNAKCKVSGLAKQGKAKAMAKASARSIIEELEGQGLNEKNVRKQARARGVSKQRLSQLRPKTRPTAKALVERERNAGASPADIRAAMKEHGFCDRMVQIMVKRLAATGKPAAIRPNDKSVD